MTQNRSFDTEQATSSYATGFVVDDVRGIIVTNRHVVTPGAWQAAHVFHRVLDFSWHLTWGHDDLTCATHTSCRSHNLRSSVPQSRGAVSLAAVL